MIIVSTCVIVAGNPVVLDTLIIVLLVNIMVYLTQEPVTEAEILAVWVACVCDMCKSP